MPEPAKRKLLVFAQAPGEAVFLKPIIKELLHDKIIDPLVFAYKYAEEYFKKNNVPFEKIEKWNVDFPLTENEAVNFLKKTNCDFILTGTVYSKNFDNDISNANLILAARKIGTPSFAFLDHWQGFDRFHGSKNEPLKYLPDTLAVVDEYSRQKMVAENVPQEKLVVTGNPHLEDIYLSRTEVMEEGYIKKKYWLKKKYGIPTESHVIVFASQLVLRKHRNKRMESVYLLDYKKTPVIKKVLTSLKKFAKKHNLELSVIIRLHPKEQLTELEFDGSGITVVADKTIDPYELIWMADVMIGLDTMLLFEAYFFGVPIISLQLWDDIVTKTDFREMTFFSCAYSITEFEKLISESFLNEDGHIKRLKEQHFYIINNSRQRMIKALYDFMQVIN